LTYWVRKLAAALALLVGVIALGVALAAKPALACDQRFPSSCKPEPPVASSEPTVEAPQPAAATTQTRSRRARSLRRSSRRARSARSSRDGRRAHRRSARKAAAKRTAPAEDDDGDLVGEAPQEAEEATTQTITKPARARTALPGSTPIWSTPIQRFVAPASSPAPVPQAASSGPSLTTAPRPAERAAPLPAAPWQATASAAHQTEKPAPQPAGAPAADVGSDASAAPVTNRSEDTGGNAPLRIVFIAIAGVLLLGTAVRLVM
jgi:hypothetical protein